MCLLILSFTGDICTKFVLHFPLLILAENVSAIRQVQLSDFFGKEKSPSAIFGAIEIKIPFLYHHFNASSLEKKKFVVGT